MSIQVEHVSKSYGAFRALDDVSLAVPTGQLVALLGPSGSGKTTLLRVIAGLEWPDPGSGAIRVDDADVAHRDVAERRVGFVFQHYALFRHMSVFENVAFGLRVRPRRWRLREAEIRERVRRLLALVQLEALGGRYPSELSGGQRQRIALARALAIEPKVLLLDEPFGALDAKVRQGLRRWLRRLHDELHVTSVFVTHDQEEALEVADRVVVMNQGRVEQTGAPDEIFHAPATAFVMDFLGNVNLFHGRVENGKARFGPLVVDPVGPGPEGAEARLFVRPHDLKIHDHPNGESSLRAVVRRVNRAGASVKLELATDAGEPLLAELSHEEFASAAVTAGQEVYVSPRSARLFLGEGE